MTSQRTRKLGLALLALAVLATTAGAQERPAPSKETLPPVIRSSAGGLWSAPATWEGGKVPARAPRLIREGHKVVYDVQIRSGDPRRQRRRHPQLAADRDTRLDVG